MSAYVEDLRDNMRLNVWNLLVVADPPKRRDAFAEITISRQAHEATLRIDMVNFGCCTRAAQRQVLTHELCHLVTDALAANIGQHATPLARGKAALRIANTTFERAMETAVDDFAWLLAPHQPLPPRGWLD